MRRQEVKRNRSVYNDFKRAPARKRGRQLRKVLNDLCEANAHDFQRQGMPSTEFH